MKQKAALVLSGGGARGIAHIGVIEELEKQGFEITSIAGTSMGALVGAAFALGKMEELKKWLCSLDRLKVFNLVDFTLSGQGFIKGDKVFKKMKEFITDKNIEDLDIPYAAVAVDIINKKEVVFNTGSIYKAIRASVSIPTVLTPIKTEEGLLVDGGVMNNIPINHVKRTQDDLLIVVDVNAEVPVLKPPKSEEENETMLQIYQKKILAFYNQFQPENQQPVEEKLGYFDLLNHTIGFMTHQIAMHKLEKHPPDLVINISHHICNAFDFYKAEELIEIGRYVTQKRMEEYGKDDHH
ncbi:MAG: patatin-like phospholipase family protein [Bacteroidales bacterium]|nr:patatin-like phospholipase family protein [Bacteroidales bacterium]